jgi:hypothetical protein
MVRKTVDILKWCTAIVRPAIAVGAILWLGPVACTQTAPTGGESGTSARTVWGEPDLMGVWKSDKLGARDGQDSFNLTQLEGLYRPEGRARMKALSAQDDPSALCRPHAFPRAAALGWPVQILQSPGKVFVFSEAFMTHRIIPTNGEHLPPTHLVPMWLGDSAARWEGDTLVVDVLSFNGETWLAGSQDKPTGSSTGVWPTSEEMHVVERWRRVDADTLEYQARVEDPAMLTAPWETPVVTLRRQPDKKIKEVKCLIDNPQVTPDPAMYLAQFGR